MNPNARPITCSSTCRNQATAAYQTENPDLTWQWPDGPAIYGLACPQHRERIDTYQTHQIHWYELDTITITLGCAAYWGSHGCALSEAHQDQHICLITLHDEDDHQPHTEECCRPTEADEVLHINTDQPCSTRGGISSTNRSTAT